MRIIDGDALKEKLPNTYHNGFENCRECRLLEREEVNAYIDRMPTIDAAPVKHGKWSTKRTQKHSGGWYCTVCDYVPIVMSDDMKYCPACGAKMDLKG